MSLATYFRWGMDELETWEWYYTRACNRSKARRCQFRSVQRKTRNWSKASAKEQAQDLSSSTVRTQQLSNMR